MRKGYYLTVPSADAEKQPWFDEKHSYYSTTSSPLISNFQQQATAENLSWFNHWWTHLFMSARQKEKSTRRSLLRTRTKGIKLLCTLLFCTISMYFIHRFIDNHIKFGLPSETASDLFKSIPSSDHIKRHLLDYTTHQRRVAGSDTDKTLAEWTRDRFIQYGVTDTSIETYWPLLNYPKQTKLTIVTEDQEEILLYEAKSLSEDNTLSFHAYSGSGNVTGPIVYVNYGRLTDFQFLSTRGIQFNGTIALMRHGVIKNGMKVKMAEDFGCIGAILYEDSEEQPEEASALVKQGSVMYSSFIAGDPLTQGYPATSKNANITHRITYDEAKGIPKIPSLPVSWQDALSLLKMTEGLGIEADLTWLGGLCNVHYFSGPSHAQVNLVNINGYEIKPIWNVVGKIPGSIEPERVIIIGNHRDAWHTGAMDPGSGSAVLMELVRTIGILLDRGWRPKRTLIFASWDAQEYGSVGSTEWVEDHQSWLQEEAIAYLNVDYAVTGNHFTASSSPLFHQLLYQVTKQVIDPHTSISVHDVWKSDQSQSQAEQDFYFESSPADNQSPFPLVDILDSDSDTTAFFNHLGISSISFGFRDNSDNDLLRHTKNDTVEYMMTHVDPTFEYHQTLTRIWGLLVLKLTSDMLLPMHTQDYSTEIIRYISRLSARQGCSSFPFLSSVLHSLSATSLHFDKQRDRWEKQLNVKKHISKKLARHVSRTNERLVQFERAFIDPLGMSKDRPWFKHVVFGPQLNTGMPQAFPGLAEAVDKDDVVHIKFMEERIGKLLMNAERSLQGRLGDDDDEEEDK